MPRLIDADELRKEVKQKGTSSELIWCVAEIDRAPTIEAEPVRRGRWVGKPIAGYCYVRCSVCCSVFSANSGKWSYCPNCGHPMDGGEKA